jgi:hypothetical protein
MAGEPLQEGGRRVEALQAARLLGELQEAGSLGEASLEAEGSLHTQ